MAVLTDGKTDGALCDIFSVQGGWVVWFEGLDGDKQVSREMPRVNKEGRLWWRIGLGEGRKRC